MMTTGFYGSNATVTCSNYLENVWPGIWRNRAYSSLPRKPIHRGVRWLRYTGRYNTSLGSWTKHMTLNVNSTGPTNIYVGMIIYYVTRASHRHSGWGENAGTMNYTVRFVDGTTQSGSKNSGWFGKTHDAPYYGERYYASFSVYKPVRSIDMSFVIRNQGAQYHDCGDRSPVDSVYSNGLRSRGFNKFPNDPTGYDLFGYYGNIPYVRGDRNNTETRF